MITVLFTACNKQPELPKTGTPKIVLLGELVAEDSIYFRAGQSIPIIAGSTAQRVLIQDLEITVKNQQGTAWILQHKEDELSSSEFTLPYFSNKLIQASGVYNITAVHPKYGTATVMVPVPKPFIAIADTSNVIYEGEPCLQANISITDLPATGNAYAIEVVQQPYFIEPSFFFNGQWLKQSDHTDLYDSLKQAGATVPERMDRFYARMFNRIMFFTKDAFAEHVKSGKASQEINRAIFEDAGMNGTTINSRIYIPRKNIFASQPGAFGYLTLIQVKSIASDYFNYLKSYQQVDHTLGLDELFNKVQITGNVQNGLGMIGGVFLRQFGYDL